MDTSDEPAMFPKMSPLAIELTNCNNLEEVICLFSNFNEQSIRSRGYIEVRTYIQCEMIWLTYLLRSL